MAETRVCIVTGRIPKAQREWLEERTGIKVGKNRIWLYAEEEMVIDNSDHPFAKELMIRKCPAGPIKRPQKKTKSVSILQRKKTDDTDKNYPESVDSCSDFIQVDKTDVPSNDCALVSL